MFAHKLLEKEIRILRKKNQSIRKSIVTLFKFDNWEDVSFWNN